MTENPRADHYLVPWILDALDRYASGRALEIIDVGCGDGYVATHLTQRGHHIKGFDTSEVDVSYAKSHHAGIDFSVHSVYEKDLPERLGPADCVVAIEVLEHLYQPREFFRFCRSVLKPGGLLLVTTPYHGYLKNLALSLTNGWDAHFLVDWEGGHIKFFSRQTLEAMMKEEKLTPLRFDGIGRLPGFWKSMGLAARA